MENTSRDIDKRNKKQEKDKELARMISSSGEVFEMATTNEEEEDNKKKMKKIKEDMRKRHN